MIKFGRFIAKHRVLILILAVLLLIPSVLGYISTRVNYDVLTYLPDDIDTMEMCIRDSRLARMAMGMHLTA